MLVKLYTDASHSAPTKVGAYGCVIEGVDGVHRASGVLSGDIECPTQAEVRAAVVGAYLALKRYERRVTKLVLHLDSKPAMRMLAKTSWFWERDKYKGAVETFAKLTQSIEIEFVYVRSHQGGGYHDSARNEECDRASRDARYKAEAARGIYSRRSKGVAASKA